MHYAHNRHHYPIFCEILSNLSQICPQFLALTFLDRSRDVVRGFDGEDFGLLDRFHDAVDRRDIDVVEAARIFPRPPEMTALHALKSLLTESFGNPVHVVTEKLEVMDSPLVFTGSIRPVRIDGWPDHTL